MEHLNLQDLAWLRQQNSSNLQKHLPSKRTVISTQHTPQHLLRHHIPDLRRARIQHKTCIHALNTRQVS